jgi:two-component system response regulator FixJ
MERPGVFIVSANEAVRDSTRQLVESAGLQAETFASMQIFLDAVAQGRQGCLLLDACQNDLIDPLRQTRLAAAFDRMPGLLLTDRGDVPMAVLALKAGAMDVVQKPYSNENLLGRIKHALLADENLHG